MDAPPPGIPLEWDEAGIRLSQLCGVWLFGHWRSRSDWMRMEPFVNALARQVKAE